MSTLTHRHFVPNLYDFLCLRRYILTIIEIQWYACEAIQTSFSVIWISFLDEVLLKVLTFILICVHLKVHAGRSELVCPITECSGFLEESLVISHLSSEELTKYKYFLELSRLDSSTKPCPQCSLFTSLKGHGQQTSTKTEHKYKV